MKTTRSQDLERQVAMLTIVLPSLGTLVAVALAVLGLVPLHAWISFLVMYTLTMLGITAGFHRMATHRAFQAGPRTRSVLLALGSMAAQGPVLFWAVSHRRHHEATDADGDPHSPHQHGSRALSGLRGLVHSHVGWMLEHYQRPEDVARYGKDLLRDRRLMASSAAYPTWVAIGLALPTVAGALLERSWTGAAMGLLFGGFLRMFAAHHATWCVNSICHLIGSQGFKTGDQSRNSAVVALLTFGEGWHNNHHAFPSSARHGLRWWQLDMAYLCIAALAACGLVTSVRVPSRAEQGRKSFSFVPEGELQS